MATANNIVIDALKIAGVVAAEETPSADMIADAVTRLNRMLHSWELEGVDLAWSDVAQSDTLGVDDAYLDGITYNLAVRLCPEYGRQAPPEVAAIAGSKFSHIKADAFDPGEPTHDISLLQTDAHYRRSKLI